MVWARNVVLFISRSHNYGPWILVKPERAYSKSIAEAEKQRSCLHLLSSFLKPHCWVPVFSQKEHDDVSNSRFKPE